MRSVVPVLERRHFASFFFLIGLCGVDVTSATPQSNAAIMVNIKQSLDLKTRNAAVAVAWSRDGSALAAASNFGSDIYVWDASGRPITHISRPGEGPVVDGSISFARGSSQLVFPPPATSAPDSGAAVWEVANGEISQLIVGPQPGDDYPLNRFRHFDSTPEQTVLAASTSGNRGFARLKSNLTLYDMNSWKILGTTVVPQGIASLCIFGQGQYVAVGTLSSGGVFIFDSQNLHQTARWATFRESESGLYSIGAIAGSNDGKLIFAGIGTVTLTGAESAEQASWASRLSTSDAVQLLQVKDGAVVARFKDAKAPIRHAAWDPKGRFVAFVDNYRDLFLWAPWTGAPYTRVELPTGSMALAVSPSGDKVAVTTDFGVRLYVIIAALGLGAVAPRGRGAHDEADTRMTTTRKGNHAL
jgi:WD40 repeat protein